MLFKVFVRRDGILDCWTYDNDSNVVRDSSGVVINPFAKQDCVLVSESETTSIFEKNNNPNKPLRKLRLIEIALGMNCNFNCEYCSQAPYKNKGYNGKPSDVDSFFSMLDEAGVTLDDKFGRFNLWGGEPLVYWKTLRVLIPRLRSRYPNCKIKMVTNGSLLTKQKIDFFVEYKVDISVSDDGLNESRGKDAIANEKNDPIFEYAAKVMGDRFLIGTVHSLGNANAITKCAILKKRIPSLANVYTGNVVRCFNLIDGDIGLSTAMFRMSDKDLITMHDSSYQEFDERPIPLKLKGTPDFVPSIIYGKHLYGQGQCDIPTGRALCVNLRGDIFPCHSRASIGNEVGHLRDYGNVEIKGHTHWSMRKNCANCPVLAVCRGNCSIIGDAEHEISCPNYFARFYAIFRRFFEGVFGVFVVAIEPVEGEMMPVNKLLNWRVPERTPFDATSPTVIPIKPI